MDTGGVPSLFQVNSSKSLLVLKKVSRPLHGLAAQDNVGQVNMTPKPSNQHFLQNKQTNKQNTERGTPNPILDNGHF